MRKIFLVSFIVMLTMVARISVRAAQGWPANYSGVMLQGFYWDSYDDSKWYKLTERADELSKYFDLIWIPNAATETTVSDYESTTQSMGYTPIYYFKYNTIFGSEDQLRTMINTYKAKGTGIIEDVVINHKSGVTGWCDFANESVVGQNTGKTYSVTWDNTNFSGICSTDECNSSGYTTTGAVDTGDDFDGSRDLDHTNTTVQQNLITYQDYLLNELGFAGFRLDMVKGYSGTYTKMYNEAVNPTYSVGEYWDTKDNITNWIKTTNYTSAAFDFPLKFVLNSVFDSGNWDALSDKSFTADVNYNRYSVTFVENHDTYRSNKLNNSWSAANAFILAMPGTPCIFLPHYTADPTHIQAMITARKACGITNQSTILQQYKYNSGYVIETQGTNGRVYLQLGDATGMDAPDGYFLVASATDGTPYKYFAKKNSAGTTTGSYTIYFDNSTGNWDNVYCYTWDQDGNYAVSWPGQKLTEKDASGRYYKYTITANDSYGVIFNNGSGTQTANLAMANKCVYRSTGIEYDNYLELPDGSDFTDASNSYYSEASYTRSMSYEWGTLVLPFPVTYNASNGNYKLYYLSKTSADALTFTEYADGTRIAAGTPMAIKAIGEKNEDKYTVAISANNVATGSVITATSAVGGLSMNGTYTNVTDKTNVYFIAQDKFWRADEAISIAPFRAWFEGTISGAKSLTITVNDDDVNAIESVPSADETKSSLIYNLAGQRLSAPQKGINIINGKKILIK